MNTQDPSPPPSVALPVDCFREQAVQHGGDGLGSSLPHEHTAADLAFPVLAKLLSPKKKRRRKKPPMDPVEYDFTQITKEEATRRFAELRREINAKGEAK